jgi:hypothetical protein
MVSVQRVVSQQIPAEPAEVRAFYVDLSNLKALHPFLVSVEAGPRRSLADGYVQEFRIREDVPLGPVRLPIRFRARLTVPSSGPTISESFQFPRVRLRTVVSFEPAGMGQEAATLLTEHIRFSAPWPLVGVTVRQGVAAHREMLVRLAAKFATGRLP